MAIQAELRRILEQRETLSYEEAAALMRRILSSSGDRSPGSTSGPTPTEAASGASNVELAALLGALAARGETAAEVAGFAAAMREAASTLPLTAEEQDELVDTCGTGGDASASFNISTAAALVAAGAGARVAKHGNRAITSKCGSADVLEALGIATQLAPAAAAASLREVGFCFLLAPAHHPTLRAVMPVRRALGVRTVLHVLGPLLNPAGARRQVMGVYQARLVPLVAEAMTLLGVRHAMVVHGDGPEVEGAGPEVGSSTGAHGNGSARGQGSASGKGSARGRLGIDELALSGPSQIAEVRDGVVLQYTVTPEEFGLTRAPLSALEGGDAAANAEILTGIFAGQPGPRRDIVLLNAAAVLVTAGRARDIGEGVDQAAHAIDSRAVARLVQDLRHRHSLT